MLPTIFDYHYKIQLDKAIAERCGIKAAILHSYISTLNTSLAGEDESTTITYDVQVKGGDPLVPWVRVSFKDLSVATGMTRAELTNAFEKLEEHRLILRDRPKSDFDKSFFYKAIFVTHVKEL